MPYGWYLFYLCFNQSSNFILQLVYDHIPTGDLQQREIWLSVLSEEGFWENILLGEVTIRLRDLDLSQEKICWFKLGSATQDN